jgi:hypothetical protein
MCVQNFVMTPQGKLPYGNERTRQEGNSSIKARQTGCQNNERAIQSQSASPLSGAGQQVFGT